MALVDDDEVEEFRAKLSENLFAIGADELLIQGEVNLVGRIEFAMLNLRDNLAQRLEIAINGLVNEDIPISQIEHFSSQARLAQAMNYLKGRVRLARASRHDEEELVLALGDRLDRSIDSVALVIARRVTAVFVIVRR